MANLRNGHRFQIQKHAMEKDILNRGGRPPNALLVLKPVKEASIISLVQFIEISILS